LYCVRLKTENTIIII